MVYNSFNKSMLFYTNHIIKTKQKVNQYLFYKSLKNWL